MCCAIKQQLTVNIYASVLPRLVKWIKLTCSPANTAASLSGVDSVDVTQADSAANISTTKGPKLCKVGVVIST